MLVQIFPPEKPGGQLARAINERQAVPPSGSTALRWSLRFHSSGCHENNGWEVTVFSAGLPALVVSKASSSTSQGGRGSRSSDWSGGGLTVSSLPSQTK